MRIDNSSVALEVESDDEEAETEEIMIDEEEMEERVHSGRANTSCGCNTAAARHHGRTCTDMDVIVVQAAFPHIFDRQVFRKALILDIGVCIMEEK